MPPGRRTMLALLLGLALAGCASAGASQSQVSSPAAVSPTATSGPSPSPTATVSDQTCSPSADALRAGDLAISRPEVLYGFNADFMLPDGLATQPLTVTLQNNESHVAGVALLSRPVVLPAAFFIGICNTSATRSHHLTSFGVQLALRTPYSGYLNALNGCAFLYSQPSGTGGECASGFSPDFNVSFAFPPAPPAAVTQDPGSPIELPPGRGTTISFDIQPPTGSAIVTYRLGLSVDGQAIAYPAALTTQPAVSAPIARRWAGDYCAVAAMQAQIPATIPPNTYYVCPKV